MAEGKKVSGLDLTTAPDNRREGKEWVRKLSDEAVGPNGVECLFTIRKILYELFAQQAHEYETLKAMSNKFQKIVMGLEQQGYTTEEPKWASIEFKHQAIFKMVLSEMKKKVIKLMTEEKQRIAHERLQTIEDRQGEIVQTLSECDRAAQRAVTLLSLLLNQSETE